MLFSTSSTHLHILAVHRVMHDVTLILSAIEQGDASAADKLLPLVYDELRKLAAARMAQESPGQTLQATALVHEAYLRLVTGSDDSRAWDGRGHFFSAAAEAMRRILIENARRKQQLKRGGDMDRVEIEELDLAAPHPREDLLSLDAALTKLQTVETTAAELVQLRYFAGLTLAEAAEVLKISSRSADRTWAYARAWLRRELQNDPH
jgi:RNA polymerase sigma factor (TIGR02999 family)